MLKYQIAETIYEFIKYCNSCSSDDFSSYIPTDECNLKFIQKWIDEVWSKDKGE